MNASDPRRTAYIQIRKEELRPAMGCTEPIAIAYAAARARAVLGARPDRLLAEVSGNIIKNVKSVVVPHTGGLRGIPAAAAVDAGLPGLAMYENGSQFFGGDGIVKKGVENTIASVGKLARFGMEQTDKEIIRLMMEC